MRLRQTTGFTFVVIVGMMMFAAGRSQPFAWPKAYYKALHVMDVGHQRPPSKTWLRR